jgi:two-component system, NtrC family, sensor kinase
VESSSRAGPPANTTGSHDLEQASGALGAMPERAGREPTAQSAADAQAWFLARLLDRTTHPFALVAFDGRIVRANRAYAELLGYTVEELSRLNLRDVTPQTWIARTADPLARLRATGKTERYEKEYLRKDGRLVPVEIVVELFCDEHEVPQGYFAFVTDVTERKQAESALRASEERFRMLYDEAPVGYHEIDTEGTILSVNHTECELLGYSREEMLGRPVFDFVAPEARAQARLAVREKIEGKRPLHTLERRYVTHDGRELVISIEDRLNLDEHGRVVGIRSTVQDITARKQTEAALVASERRARALFEGIDDAVFVHDMDGRILDANPAACRRLGYTCSELLELTTREIEDTGFARSALDRLQEQLHRGHLSYEGCHRAKDGSLIPVEINTSIIQFEGQRAILAVVRDITERQALEESRRRFDEAHARNAREMEAKNRALTQSESRYRQLTEGCLDAVVVADQQSRITLFNPSAERAFGYTANEVIGHSLTMLMPERYRQAHDDGFARYVATRDPRLVGRTVELFGLRKNGEEFPLELSLSAVEMGGQLQFIGSIRDQTERQRMRAILMQTEKLASIGLLSAGVAHEINNPLSYIGNNLAVLERDLKGMLAIMATYEAAHDRLATVAPDVAAQLEALSNDLDWPYVRDNLDRLLCRTRDGVARVANIVHNLRGLARTAPPKMEEVLVPDLLATTLEMVHGRLRLGNIEVKLDYDKVPKVPCVPAQIGQVLLNLVVNAIQAVEEVSRPEGRLIRIAIEQSGSEQVISICDNGCGVDPESMTRLFDPFFTTKPVGEGTGLGLAISHGIVTGHGGRIEVESRLGAGSCFRVHLPMKAR